MKCSNCGTVNDASAKFCLKCGNPLVNNGGDVNNQVVPGPNNNVNINQNIQQPLVNANAQPQVQNTNSLNIKDYILYGVNMLIKPYKTYKEKENQTSNVKFSLIYSAVMICIMTIVNLVTTMISSVFVKSFDYNTLNYTNSIDFGNLKRLNYLSIIGKHLLYYALLVFGIAFIYYIVCLILKKQNNYFKNLSILASSIIPYIVLGMFLSSIAGLIWSPLNSLISSGGMIYSGLILVNLINDNMNFTSTDQKIYFHLLCLFVAIVMAYIFQRILFA